MTASLGSVVITLSEDQLKFIIDQAKKEVLADVESRISLNEKVIMLPPLANENQIRKILGLGNTKVKYLIRGLEPLFLGGSTALYDRADIRKAIENDKIKIQPADKRKAADDEGF